MQSYARPVGEFNAADVGGPPSPLVARTPLPAKVEIDGSEVDGSKKEARDIRRGKSASGGRIFVGCC